MFSHQANLKKITFDFSGKPGEVGKKGYDGSIGSKGRDGYDGQCGENAKDVTMRLRLENNLAIGEFDNKRFSLPLGHPDSAITIKAKGGDGGRGGAGGKGGEGYRGEDGTNATRYFSGTNGTNGGRGGDGGRGGNGGNGGDGKCVTIKTSAQDSDLLLLVEQPIVASGKGAKGGSGGLYGKGGPGGSGGQSYVTVETQHTYHYDSEGVHSHTTQVPIFVAGGCDGEYGGTGKSGESGQNGRDGLAGRYCYFLDNIEYSDRYKLYIDHDQIKGKYGYPEPNEMVHITGIRLHNTGEMPSPIQETELAIEPSAHIQFNENGILTGFSNILPHYVDQLPRPLEFKIITDNLTIPARDETFKQRSQVKIIANSPRVNKQLTSVSEQITIRYPVEISAINYVKSISPKEEAAFAIELRNISPIDLGEESIENRNIALKLEIESGLSNEAMVYYSEQQDDLINSNGFYLPYTIDVGTLPAHSSYIFAGTLAFNPNLLPVPYTIVTLKISLMFADDSKNLATIQERTFQIQLANSYEYDESANIVLVTNANTSTAIVKSWENLAALFNTKISIWNASLNSGLGYFSERYDGSKFINTLQGKTVVILNNVYRNNQGQAQVTTDYLDKMELFDAYHAQIATYVVGENFNLEKAIFPLANNENFQPLSIYRKKYLSHDQITFKNELKEIVASQENKTGKRLIAIGDYQPRNPTGFFDMNYYLGTVNIRPSLDKTHAHIIHRKCNKIQNADDLDIYNFVHLQPFTTKINYLMLLEKTPKLRKVLVASLLSDLTNEMQVFKSPGLYIHKRTNKLQERLQLFMTLIDFNFEKIFTTQIAKEALLEVLSKFEYLIKLSSVLKERMIYFVNKNENCIQFYVKHISQFIIDNFSKEMILAAIEEDKVKEAYQGFKFDKLFEIFINGLNINKETQYDHLLSLQQVCNKNELPAYHQERGKFSEYTNLFFNRPEERVKRIQQQKEKCIFDLKL